MYQSAFISRINQSHHPLLISVGPVNSELNVRHLITLNGSHLDVILAYIKYLGHGKNPLQIELYPETSAGAGGTLEVVGAGLNSFPHCKAFHRLTNTALGCLSIFSGGVPVAAMRSNHICFQFTFTGPLQPAGIAFQLLEVPLCVRSFPQPENHS